MWESTEERSHPESKWRLAVVPANASVPAKTPRMPEPAGIAVMAGTAAKTVTGLTAVMVA